MDIDFSQTPDMDWEAGLCTRGQEHKCAVKNTSICKYFQGLEYPDVVLCSYSENKS